MLIVVVAYIALSFICAVATWAACRVAGRSDADQAQIWQDKFEG